MRRIGYAACTKRLVFRNRAAAGCPRLLEIYVSESSQWTEAMNKGYAACVDIHGILLKHIYVEIV